MGKADWTGLDRLSKGHKNLVSFYFVFFMNNKIISFSLVCGLCFSLKVPASYDIMYIGNRLCTMSVSLLQIVKKNCKTHFTAWILRKKLSWICK